MDPLHALLLLLLVVAAIAIVIWALRSVDIPPPFRWIINIAIAIIALWVLFTYVAPMLGVGTPRLYHSAG